MTARRRLRDLIERDEIAYLPGVHDALSAKIAASHDADALQHSGYGTAASLLGYPDLNFTSLSETVHVVRSMVRAAGDTPVVVDADTGYGGVANIPHTVAEIENTGAAGLFIEDQAVPKKCGLMEGKDLVSPEEMAGKVEAVLDARSDEEFVVMARTDAYAEAGVEEVIHRGNVYADAGAEVFMLGEVAPLSALERIAAEVEIPFYALGVRMDGTDFEPWHPLDVYDDAGIDLISDVSGLLQVSVAAMHSYLDDMDQTGDSDVEMQPLDDVSDFLGAEEYEQFASEHRRE